MLILPLITLTLFHNAFSAHTHFTTPFEDAQKLLCALWSTQKDLLINQQSYQALVTHTNTMLNRVKSEVPAQAQKDVYSIFELLDYYSPNFQAHSFYFLDNTLIYTRHHDDFQSAVPSSPLMLSLYNDSVCFTGKSNIFMFFLNKHFNTKFTASDHSPYPSFGDWQKDRQEKITATEKYGCRIFCPNPPAKHLPHGHEDFRKHLSAAWMRQPPSQLSLRTNLLECQKLLHNVFKFVTQHRNLPVDVISHILYTLTVDHSTCMCALKAPPVQQCLMLLAADALLPALPQDHTSPTQVNYFDWTYRQESLFHDCYTLNCMRLLDFVTSSPPPTQHALPLLLDDWKPALIEHFFIPRPPATPQEPFEPNALLLLLANLDQSFVHTSYNNPSQTLTLPRLDEVILYSRHLFTVNYRTLQDTILKSIALSLAHNRIGKYLPGISDAQPIWEKNPVHPHLQSVQKMLLFFISYLSPDYDHITDCRLSSKKSRLECSCSNCGYFEITIPPGHLPFFETCERLSLSQKHFQDTALFISNTLNLKNNSLQNHMQYTVKADRTWKGFQTALSRKVVQPMSNPLQELAIVYKGMNKNKRLYTYEFKSSLDTIYAFMRFTFRSFKDHYTDPTIRAILHRLVDTGLHTQIPTFDSNDSAKNLGHFKRMLLLLTTYIMPKITGLDMPIHYEMNYKKIKHAVRVTPFLQACFKAINPLHETMTFCFIRKIEQDLFHDCSTCCAMSLDHAPHTFCFAYYYLQGGAASLPEACCTFKDYKWVDFSTAVTSF